MPSRLFRIIFPLPVVLICLLSACDKRAAVGGPLPLINEWTEGENPGAAPPVTGAAEDTPLNIRVSPSAIGDDMPVSRALAAKMLALMYYDAGNIGALDYDMPFTDVPETAWYAKYINAVYARGLMAGDGHTFMPDEPLTLEQANGLLAALAENNRSGITVSEEDKQKPVSYALWTELYIKLLESASGESSVYDAFGIEAAGMIVLAASANNPALTGGQSVADTGLFSHAGLDMNAFLDKEIRVLHKNKEIIALVALISERPVLRGAYLFEADGEGITVFSGGARRFYAYGGDCRPVPGEAAGKVCDIQISDAAALSVSVIAETVAGTVLRTSANAVEFKEWGVMPLAPDFKTYALTGGAVKWKQYINLLVGTDAATFYVQDGALRAGVIERDVTPERIRVAIGTSGFAGMLHNSVSVTSAGAFTVSGGGIVKTFAAGQRFTVSDIENTDLWGQPRLFIASDGADGTLQLLNIKRAWPGDAPPRYRGVIEIAREENGYSIVNELSLEEYLYAVIPSEMPSGYGAEAAKAQAVTARSYAYNQFYENRFHAYGAHVDDSVMCQVYNNIPENSVSIEAADATRGLCLTYGGQVIAATFFSTSCGYTANGGEVWASGGAFPAATAEYLRAKPQSGGVFAYGSLADETNASAFFKDMNADAYDSGFSWFRWNARMTAEEIAASVNAGLAARYNASPQLIKTNDGNGNYRSAPVETIGELTDMRVTRRGEGGNIMEMIFTGTEAEVLVKTEYNIRMLLAPVNLIGRDITIHRSDGTSAVNYSLMPSAFFTFDREYDDNGALAAVTFYGGGNGHGAGMSQNGVKGMTDMGYTYSDALSHFYPCTEIKPMY